MQCPIRSPVSDERENQATRCWKSEYDGTAAALYLCARLIAMHLRRRVRRRTLMHPTRYNTTAPFINAVTVRQHKRYNASYHQHRTAA